MAKLNIVEGMNLKQIEPILLKRAQNITIISQMHLRGKELEYLIKAFEVPLDSSDQKYMVKSLWSKYPFSCLACTVYLAIFKYDGNFWDHFRRYIIIKDTGLWKNLFLETIKKKELKVFDQNRTQKYLNNILGHAGIPQKNVAIFIRNVIIPAAENDLDAYEIYELIKINSNSLIKTYHLFKGVIDFIKLGDEVSINLINRILKLWKEQHKPFYKNNLGYLPDHLLKGMDKYLKENAEHTYRNKNPIAHPKLRLNPAALKVVIHLPIIKQKNSSINDVKWVITNKQTLESHEISTVKIELSGGVNEFLVEEFQKDYVIMPKYQYSVELYYNNNLETEFVFNQENILFFHPKTNEQLVDINKPFKELQMVASNDYIKDISSWNSQTYHYNMNQTWRGYSLIEVEATHTEEIVMGNHVIVLSNKDSLPYLSGKLLDNIGHERFTVYEKAPILIVPKEFTPFFMNKFDWHLKLFSKGTGESESFSIVDMDKTFTVNGDVRIPLKSSEVIQDTGFGEFELMLYGPLGTDITFNFIMGENINVRVHQDLFMKRKKLKSIQFHVPSSYNAEVIWPENINMFQKLKRGQFIDFSMKCSIDQYKIVIQFTNDKTDTSLPLVLYTKPYDAKIIYQNSIFQSGTMTDKTEINLEKARLVIDLENPSLNKYNSEKFEITLKSKTADKYIHKSVRIGKKVTIPLSYFSDVHDKYSVELYCKIDPIETEYRPFLFIDNNWKVTNFNYSYDHESIEMKWEESFSQENMQLKIWKLDEPTKANQKFDLSKGQTKFTLNNGGSGYYLLEWLEKNNNPFAFLLDDKDNQPSYKHGQYQVIKVDTPYTLSELTLLHDKDGLEYEFESEEFEQLVHAIKQMGPKYVSLLTEDYDACCDFGIRNIDLLIDLVQNPDEDREMIEILLLLAGFAEWDYSSLRSTLATDVNQQVIDDVQNTNKNYFGDKIAMQMIAQNNGTQLNIMLQQMQLDHSVIQDFSVTQAHIEFIKKMKVNSNYRQKIVQLLEDNYMYITNVYQQKKEKNKFDYRLFKEIDKRDYQLDNLPGNTYPYLIAKVALLNRLLSISEISFSDEERKGIRSVTKKILETDKAWLTHDLVYISGYYEMLIKTRHLNKERSKAREYSSFKWKS
ncbi:hypothetical protein [Virgibacillus sp. YIM 98842]|uniref:hypothetical protein n=1 Tax=Virgibacillus sp. YIM 98842 TaxID=2663533 RepID=UPI0013DD3225|nr:hypothetical protein [Virgibacillus sp. YIM 98842]